VAASVQIRRAVLDELCGHAKKEPARECCGLLAGRDGVVTDVFPAENVAADPARGYEIGPREVVRRMREFRASGLEFLGIYHSHPKTDNAPSPADIEQAYYSEEAYFIVSPLADASRSVRAFSIREGRATELAIEVVP
jgi:proteasome lid subunit RPN8/RPN11